MNYKLDERRKATMREHLGDACLFIDDERYLPLYRNRQKRFPAEFAKSVELAKKIKLGAKRYFARIWGSKNLKQSLEILRSIINKAKSLAAKIRFQKKQEARIAKAHAGADLSKRNLYQNMKRLKLARTALL